MSREYIASTLEPADNRNHWFGRQDDDDEHARARDG